MTTDLQASPSDYAPSAVEPDLAVRRAFREAIAVIEAMAEPAEAYERATRLAEAMRQMADAAAQKRAVKAAQLKQAEDLSLAALAERIGVSKARADQFVRTARND